MLKRCIMILVLSVSAGAALADNFDEALQNFRTAPGTAPFFANSYGYALFPTIGKAGIVVGGAYGSGRVYERSAHTGNSSMAQVSIGFQLGGQAYSQIVFFKNKAAHDLFTSGNFEFSAEASAVAVTLGAQAKAGTSGASASGNIAGSESAEAAGEWYKDMAIFTLAKGGLMYEAAIAGQKFSYRPVGASR